MLSRDVMQMENSKFSVFQVQYEVFIDGQVGNKKKITWEFCEGFVRFTWQE